MPKSRSTIASDEAVKKATGKTWAEWCRVLDTAGAEALDHKGIVALLRTENDIGAWWCQMVTVGYERARGLRKKHEKPDGFEVSVNKTIGAPIATLYRAWSDLKQRKRWLADPAFTVRTATENKSMRITWIDGRSRVEVAFYAKGAAKSQVSVQHGRLASAAAGERMKAYWRKALGGLAERLVAD